MGLRFGYISDGVELVHITEGITIAINIIVVKLSSVRGRVAHDAKTHFAIYYQVVIRLAVSALLIVNIGAMGS